LDNATTQFVATVEYPTSIYARILSPYLIVNSITLCSHRQLRPLCSVGKNYPKKIQTKPATIASVAKTPKRSIVGRKPETAAAQMMFRSPLQNVVSTMKTNVDPKTYAVAAMTSALRECMMSMVYADIGVNVKSICHLCLARIHHGMSDNVPQRH
jgi:hypothetical protein